MELFFAIEFSLGYKKILCGINRELQKLLDVSYSHFEPKEKLHLTLSYVLEADDHTTIVEQFKDFSYSAFTIHPQGINSFVNDDEIVYWVGIPSEKEVLSELKCLVDEILIRNQVDVEQRAYVPHITLAYSRKEDALPLEVLSELHTDLPPFYVDEIHLFRAPISLESTNYEKLATFKLVT